MEDDFIDIQIKILDQDKDVVYEETQPGVQVVRGAINVMIGEGIEPGSSPSKPTGGIPADAVDPENGTHFLQVQFGSNLPSDGMELGSVPYAMYAEKALKIDFNIAPPDIPGIFVTEDELKAAILAHENDTTAHPASSITTVDEFGDNVQGASVNVQDVLDDLDAAIDAEEVDRASGDAGLQGQIDTINSTIDNINDIPGTLDESKIDPDIARDSEISNAVVWTDIPGQIPDSKVPQRMRPFAFGTYARGTGALSGSSYNMVSGSGTCAGFGALVQFAQSAPNANYIASATAVGGTGPAYIQNKTASGFEACVSAPAGFTVPTHIDVIVFGNF